MKFPRKEAEDELKILDARIKAYKLFGLVIALIVIISVIGIAEFLKEKHDAELK